jgi:hypothetical protein
VRTEQISSVVFLDQFMARLANERRQEEIIGASVWTNLVVQLRSAVCRYSSGARRTGRPRLKLYMLSQPVRQDVVLLGAFFGYQRFQCLAEELLVALCSGPHDIQ